MDGLPLFHRIAGQPVLLVGDGEVAEIRRRLIGEAGGVVVDTPTPATRLAFVAVEEGAEAIAADLKARGLIVHVADRPDLCDVYLPAIVDRSPVVVAIGSGGMSASLSKALKERLEILLPPGLGRLARAIHAARAAVKQHFPTMAGRRGFWAAMLAPGARLDLFAPHDNPENSIAAGLAAPDSPATADIAHIELTPPTAGEAFDTGSLLLATVRTLAQADVVVHAEDVPEAVLAYARRDARRAAGTAIPADAKGRIVLIRMGGLPHRA